MEPNSCYFLLRNAYSTVFNSKTQNVIPFVQSSEIYVLLPLTSYITMTSKINGNPLWFPTTKGSAMKFLTEDQRMFFSIKRESFIPLKEGFCQV